MLATTAWDSDTVITREAEYDPWGQKLGGYSALTSPRHGFGGAEADAAAGTYTFGARTYDPTLRRWVSPDPLLAALPNIDLHVGDALNLFGYADGNPVKNTDPSGYCPVCVAVVAVGVVIGMGASAPSDTKDAPANLVGMMASVPGPAVVANAAEGVLARIAEASAPRFAGFVRALVGLEAKAGMSAAKAEAAAPAAQALKTGAEGAAKKVETTVAQDAAKSGQAAPAGGVAPTKAAHGNSASSTKAQHVYEIVRKDAQGNTEVYKYGISGGNTTQAGQSARAQSQVNALNTSAQGQYTYESSIVAKIPAGPGARREALAAEKKLVDEYKNLNGAKPPGNIRP